VDYQVLNHFELPFRLSH